MQRGKRIRQLQRYRTIATTIARSGLGYVSDGIGIQEKNWFLRNPERAELHTKSIGERIRLLLEELGPTFVKLGQLASTRPDLIPANIIVELERLQDDVPPFPYEDVQRIIEAELGDSITNLFSSFSITPIAAASIGQVHKATLRDGTEVVVKVQRPGIQKLVETDLNILADVAKVSEGAFELAQHYRLNEIVEELSKALRQEMDYSIEAQSTEKFMINSKKLPYIFVPVVYWDYCTKRVLTTSYVDGIKLSDRKQLEQLGINTKLVAERLATVIFHQILIDGFFHGDPHPGNVMALPDGRLALLDFGMVGRLSPHTKKHFASLVIALRNQSSKGVIRAISYMGVIPDEVDQAKLYADVDEMREKYYQVPLNQISLGTAIRDLFSVANRHHIRIPSELTLLGKALLTMEGVTVALDPKISIFNIAEPFGKKLFMEQMDPREIWKGLLEDAPDYFELVSDIPAALKQLSLVIRKGKLRMEVESPQLDTLMKKMDRISNQLSFSIVLLALSLVMVGLIVGAALNHSQSLFWGLPVIEIGFAVTLAMFVYVIYAIIRSGRF
ncbi:ABC transporter [Paenibacillus sp. BIHB 4019]|uniref:ABC transporter n=1 Tax=Paenibacillus sp. BIHB 4019 TaxID=1870819 RepID=A0A1B2DJ76_9BACL|nr:AarF/ABC1/UbiB kinase family protein [Paenibacillus sp. BIHB 4019]ANY67749.1 ABC transporter [Paenibacillus sp. BIHB 4019]